MGNYKEEYKTITICTCGCSCLLSSGFCLITFSVCWEDEIKKNGCSVRYESDLHFEFFNLKMKTKMQTNKNK